MNTLTKPTIDGVNWSVFIDSVKKHPLRRDPSRHSRRGMECIIIEFNDENEYN